MPMNPLVVYFRFGIDQQRGSPFLYYFDRDTSKTIRKIQVNRGLLRRAVNRYF